MNILAISVMVVSSSIGPWEIDYSCPRLDCGHNVITQNFCLTTSFYSCAKYCLLLSLSTGQISNRTPICCWFFCELGSVGHITVSCRTAAFNGNRIILDFAVSDICCQHLRLTCVTRLNECILRLCTKWVPRPSNGLWWGEWKHFVFSFSKGNIASIELFSTGTCTSVTSGVDT